MVLSSMNDSYFIPFCIHNIDGMGTAEWRAAKSPAYYKRGDYAPGLKVSFIKITAFRILKFNIFLFKSYISNN